MATDFATDEGECVRDAIEFGLAAVDVPSDITGGTLKDAFCYERSAVLAEVS